ncbi:hypothetical protein BH09PSE2_BH09PSE2_09830 [soil metagenome]
MRVLQGRPVSGLMLGAALVALGACTAEPRYPIEQGQPAGGGIQQVRPRYPTDSDARRGRTDEEGQVAAPSRRSQPPVTPYDSEGNPRTASEGGVSSRSLPPARSNGGRAASQVSPAPLAASSPYAGGAARPPVLTSPSRVTVKSGETVFDIAERFRTPVRALIEANSLQPPYALEPGAVLQIPPPLVYTVQEGDTLFGIARRFNIDPRSLANLNDITLETQLSRGRPVALPSLARDQGSNAQAAGPSPVGSALGRAGLSGSGLRGEVGSNRLGSGQASASQAPRVSRPASGLTPKTTADARAAADAATATRPSGLASSAPLGDAQVATAGRGRFITPLRGELISGFGSKGPGQRNDGVNIAAAQGSTVKAAAAGEVAYAGSAIPGFGNLVLIKHAGGWVTAYAHLDSIAVKMRSAVSQGDSVGTVGQSGGVDRPQLHFEIRYPPEPEASAKPIDPALLLPGLR